VQQSLYYCHYMHALHQEILPPNGVEFVTSLKLTPSTLLVPPSGRVSSTRTLCNLVVARSNLLRIFEVCEEPASQLEGRDEREAVGDVEMDVGGESFKVIHSSTGELNCCSVHPNLAMFSSVADCHANLLCARAFPPWNHHRRRRHPGHGLN
jgi:hypothetical protein